MASLNRWAARDPVLGQMIKAIENELTAIDDRTFRWVLKKPFPRMLLALGKLAGPCCFVMPARNRPIPANQRICRQRADALRAERVGAGRHGRENGCSVMGTP